MWPLSTAARIALDTSHSIDVRATVTSPVLGQLQLPVSGGEVTISAKSQVRRTATLKADPRFWPTSPTSLLAPYGSTCAIDYGIVLPSGQTEWVPLGVFGLAEAERERPIPSTADISVRLEDRSARIAEDRFDAPVQTTAGALTVAEITRLARETLGLGLVVLDLTGSTQVAAVIEIERERWSDGIEKLADSIAAEVFMDQLDRLVIRPEPTLDTEPVWEVRTGENGNLLAIKEKLTRATVYNRVIASGQRTDGIPPVRAIATDTDPASPTRYDGPFGKKPRFYSSALLTTVEQCQATADAQLARARGAGAEIALTAMVNPALDAGDIIRVRDSDRGPSVHILDSVTVPLEPDGVQALGTRTDELPNEQ